MIVAPDIDPVAFSMGPVSVRWYGLMYLAGFTAGSLLGVHRARRGDNDWTPGEVWDLLFYIAVGVVIG
ncbi:MAG: prolipoprotein diacylglyceryl transferase, partial [Proteobacteria bacterium]